MNWQDEDATADYNYDEVIWYSRLSTIGKVIGKNKRYVFVAIGGRTIIIPAHEIRKLTPLELLAAQAE